MARIRRLLVANRSEIALRILRTAQQLGIDTVVVYSDADADAPHVRAADLAVRLGPAPVAESYLHVERLLDAARRSGADAIHPGYGFLSENEAFAQAVVDAGLTWVGPSPAAIRQMGSKQNARALADAVGVPTVPGRRVMSAADAAAAANEIGYPVLLKASAGGGGKGMQVVRDPSGLAAAYESACRVALAAFGDDTMLLERYIDRPRHVEIQILGDTHGNVVHLFERECSIQRRHQKIVEESPSPALDPALRAAMGEAAVRLAQHIGYSNAGTVEFIVDGDGKFWFLEVNTRLQVEHPVTEQVTGLDLVALQLRVAQGEPLPFSQADLAQRGHAIEVRLYAEDPARGFLPATGTLTHVAWPCASFVRVDSGVVSGSVVGTSYDPMLAKLIVTGEDRAQAIARLAWALDRTVLHGVVTNRGFLRALVEHPAFVAGHTHTHFLTEHGVESPAVDGTHALHAALVATAFQAAQHTARQLLVPGVPAGFRNAPAPAPRQGWTVGDTVLDVAWRAAGPSSWNLEVAGHTHVVELPRIALDSTFGDSPGGESAPGDGATVVACIDGLRQQWRLDGVMAAVAQGSEAWVRATGVEVVLRGLPRFPVRVRQLEPGTCLSPMPGRVTAVHVEDGATVEAGAVLVVLEAMKMEHVVTAPTAGVVALHVQVGQTVDADAVLAVVAEVDAT